MRAAFIGLPNQSFHPPKHAACPGFFFQFVIYLFFHMCVPTLRSDHPGAPHLHVPNPLSPAPIQVKTLSEVLARSCHFLATPSLETQALALACMRDCVVKLASAGADAGERVRLASGVDALFFVRMVEMAVVVVPAIVVVDIVVVVAVAVTGSHGGVVLVVPLLLSQPPLCWT